LNSKILATSLLAVLFSLTACSSNLKPQESRLIDAVAQSQAIEADTINGIPVNRTPASTAIYTSVDEMENKSDLVVIGKATDSLEELTKTQITDQEQFSKLATPGHSVIAIDSNSMIAGYSSNRRFKVQKVLKGPDPKLKSIVISEPAAFYDGSIVALSGYSPLEKNEKYVLYLKHATSEYATTEPTFSVSGIQFGKHNLSKTDKKEQKRVDDSREFAKAIKNGNPDEANGISLADFRDKVAEKHDKEYKEAN
jgi:hypothetical protein